MFKVAQRLGRKAIGSKDVSMKWIDSSTYFFQYCVVYYKYNLKHCDLCFEKLGNFDALFLIIVKIVIICSNVLI